MQYRFTKPYKSAFGQYAEGDLADFDDDTAAWLNRDEPGCLEAAQTPEAESRAVTEAPKDRQMKAPKKTRSGPVVEDAMSTENMPGLAKGGDNG